MESASDWYKTLNKANNLLTNKRKGTMREENI